MTTEQPDCLDTTEEISQLVNTLIEAEERLKMLTKGEVDSISDSKGRTYLLRHAHEQLRSSEVNKKVAILNALPAQIALLDFDGVIISVNSAWKRFGVINSKNGDVAGVGLNYLSVCDKVAGGDSEIASSVSEGIRSVLANRVQNFSLEYPCHSPTEKLWFLVTVTPLDGMRRKRAIVMHVDVTERKKSEEALIESELRFRAMLQNVELAAKIIDLNGNVTFCNDYLLRLLELKRDDVLGSNWISRFIPPVRQEEARMAFKTVLAEGLHAQREYEVVSKSGEVHQILWNVAVVRDESGQASGIATIGANITERKSLQRQLIQSQKMEAIGSLAGAIAHDFNNLLTGMLGYAELAQLRLPKDSPVQEDLQEVRTSAERGATLVKQLLNFARQEEGDPQVVEPSKLVDGLTNLIQRLLGSGIRLQIEHIDDIGRIRLDSSQFEQLVINLVANARDAMPRGGTFTIATSNKIIESAQVIPSGTLKPGKYVLLTFIDTGTGMAREVQDRAFDPFFTTKEKGKGTGLGLSTCHGIVTNSGGNISILSEINVGTAFSIYFPQVDSPVTDHAAQEEPVPSMNGETVLIVDDQDSVRSLAAEILTLMGYRVVTARDGASALKVAQTNSAIDMLLTDIEMPGMTGAQLARTMVVNVPSLKVLFMSGYTSDQDLQELAEVQESFLQKPFSATQLSRKVWDVLNIRPHQR